MSSDLYKNVEKFVKMEKELALFDRNYNGQPYWQYIRFSVCESVFDNKINIRMGTENKKKTIKDVNKIWKSFFKSIKENQFLTNCGRYDLLYVREFLSSDRFFDTWELPDNISVVNYRHIPFDGEKNKKMHYLEWPGLKAKMANKIKRAFKIRRIDADEYIFLKRLEEQFVSEFGQSFCADKMADLIDDFFTIDRCYSKYYERILKKTGCRAIVLVCYYTIQVIPLCKVAKRMGIPIIEMQHGVINNHEEYWFEDKRGVNNDTPDFLLTFGEQHNKWIHLVSGAKAIAVGYPYQELMLQKYKKLETDNKEIIIYPESDDRFEKLMDAFINEITDKGFRVLIKLHPMEEREYKSFYPLLSQNKKAEFVTSKEGDIYYWLKKAKHHVMAGTTVGLEALVYNHVNVCIAANVPHDQTQCLIDWGVARGFCTSSELVSLIMNPLDMDNGNYEKVKNMLWKRNPQSNINEFFKMMKGNNWKYNVEAQKHE